MKTWDRFLKDVRPWAPGTPAPVAEHAVLRAAQDFCEFTRAWRVELDPITTEEGVLEYEIPLPDRAEIVRLEWAKLASQDMPVWRGGAHLRGRFVYTDDKQTLKFSQAPGAGVDLVLTCSMRPGERAIGVEDQLFSAYSRDIAKGAVAEVLAEPGRRAAFEARCAEIRVKVWRGHSSASPRVRANYF